MKRILLVGYGNIAKAFEKIMAEQEPGGSYSLTTCDLKDGQDIFQFLPRFRDVLYLAYFMQYSDKEISELLKIPVSTVTTRRRSTEDKLKEILGEYHAV